MFRPRKEDKWGIPLPNVRLDAGDCNVPEIRIAFTSHCKGEDSMKGMRKLSRRSFLGRVVGGTVAGGAFVALSGTAAAQVTDNDQGNNSDPPGRGRGTGITDNDSGRNSDPPNNGRGSRRRACTDNDRGSNADGVGRGRGTGRTDSDSGNNSDRPGCGRS
jgi:hypothetical protein